MEEEEEMEKEGESDDVVDPFPAQFGQFNELPHCR